MIVIGNTAEELVTLRHYIGSADDANLAEFAFPPVWDNAMTRDTCMGPISLNFEGITGDIHLDLLSGDLVIKDIIPKIAATGKGTQSITINLDGATKANKYNLSLTSILKGLRNACTGGTKGAPIDAKFQPLVDAGFLNGFTINPNAKPWGYNFRFRVAPTTPATKVDMSGADCYLKVTHSRAIVA